MRASGSKAHSLRHAVSKHSTPEIYQGQFLNKILIFLHGYFKGLLLNQLNATRISIYQKDKNKIQHF